VAETCAAHDLLRQQPERASEFGQPGESSDRKVGSPYLDRRRQNGWALYGLLGLTRDNKDGMHQQQQRNFRFFDAPVGLFFTTDASMQGHSLVDFGMFMQTLMLAAKSLGLDTCAQGAWRNFSKVVLRHLEAGPQEVLVCGMSLGYADAEALVNQLETPRESVANFTRWLD
jgi:nitroreductase